MQTAAKSNKTGKTLVDRPLPGVGHPRHGHPVFGKDIPSLQHKRDFIPLIRQACGFEINQSGKIEACGVTGNAFHRDGKTYKGSQSIYPFMVTEKENMGGIREFDFKHSQEVVLSGLCAWLASVPFAMFYTKKGKQSNSIVFYPMSSNNITGMELEKTFRYFLSFDHSPYGNFRVAGGYSDSPYAMLIRVYEQYHTDTSRVLPCDRWFVLLLTSSREALGYGIRAFECVIPSIDNFSLFFDPLPGAQDAFCLGTWLSQIRIRALDEQSNARYDDAKEQFSGWLDMLARSFLEDNLTLFLGAFARTEYGYALYARNTTRDEFFEAFWILIDRFSGGDGMQDEFRNGVQAFAQALESFAWHGRSGGGRKDLSHHYAIARSGSYRALVEAVTDTISGMMAAADATSSKFFFGADARQFCEWWAKNLDTDELCENNWWKVKSVLVAAINMAAVHPKAAQAEVPEDEDATPVATTDDTNDEEEDAL